MTARATGLAKVLSGGRVERYESEGRVVDGMLRPTRYMKRIAYRGKERQKIFRFDPMHRTVEVESKTWRDGKLEKVKRDTLEYYASNDIFSLYFNIGRLIPDCTKPYDKELHAVGAERHSGKVRVATITGEAAVKARDFLGEAACYLSVTVYQKLFGSKGGELYLALDRRGIVKKAVLKDVVMFGDVRGVLRSVKEAK
jgi:hypothetical protein